jgi:hypothetical protein
VSRVVTNLQTFDHRMQSNPDNSHDFADSLVEVRDERNLCCTGPPQQALYGFVLPLTVSAQSTRYLLIVRRTVDQDFWTSPAT